MKEYKWIEGIHSLEMHRRQNPTLCSQIRTSNWPDSRNHGSTGGEWSQLMMEDKSIQAMNIPRRQLRQASKSENQTQM
jgi:hypothetical protein